MKYWLLSQNALSIEYTNKLLKSSLNEEKYNIYMWNWNFNNIEKKEDITLSNLNNPKKSEWRYSVYQFAKEIKKWDKVILAQNKTQIYGIWEIIWDLEILKHEPKTIIVWTKPEDWTDNFIFSREIKWLYKANNWYFTFEDKDQITQFRRTLSEIKEKDYQKIEKLVSDNKKVKIEADNKNKTENIKEEIIENDKITLEDIVDDFDIALTSLLNEKILEKIKWKDFSVFEEKDLNTVLPSLRIELIRAWKKALLKWEIKIELSEQMWELTHLFDSILEKKQDRDDKNQENLQKRKQKEKVFKYLFAVFLLETVGLFLLIFLVWLWLLNISDITLQVLTLSTILQVWAMLTIVIKYLFPNN